MILLSALLLLSVFGLVVSLLVFWLLLTNDQDEWLHH